MTIPFFGDIGWFYLSARNALLYAQFPLLGITTSIVWLHQGPLWTFMLIPAFWLSNFHPLSPIVFILFINLFLISNFYYLISKIFGKNTALLSTIVLILNPWLMMHSRTPYHTSPIPLFEVLFLLCLIKQRDFLAGLFLGLLYQLHLLTFIFWPLMLSRLNKKSIFGFILGILPFLIAGPTQTLGIFVWIGKHIFVGFGGTGLASEAYRVVLFIPSLLLLSLILYKLPKLLRILIIVAILLFVNLSFDINKYAPFYPQYLESSKSGEYLRWWLDRVK